MVRVLWHRESNTDDYQWKAALPVPATNPSAWPMRQDCASVAAGFTKMPNVSSMEDYLSRGDALAFVVIHDGAIVCEWYGNGGRQDRPAATFSISKTVTSLLLARAVAAGNLTMDDKITTYVPELRSRDARFAAISFADLVDMRSGIVFQQDAAFPWVNQDAPRVYYASDLANTIVSQPHIESPLDAFVVESTAHA